MSRNSCGRGDQPISPPTTKRSRQWPGLRGNAGVCGEYSGPGSLGARRCICDRKLIQVVAVDQFLKCRGEAFLRLVSGASGKYSPFASLTRCRFSARREVHYAEDDDGGEDADDGDDNDEFNLG